MMLLVAVITERDDNVAVTFRRVDVDAPTAKEFGVASELQRGATDRMRGMAEPLHGAREMTAAEIEAAGLPPLEAEEADRTTVLDGR